MLTVAVVLLGLFLRLSETVTVCYLGSWAVWRPDAGKYDIDQIDPFLCTHVIYSYAQISETTWEPLEPYYDLCENWGLCAYDRFTGLKKVNPELKTLLSVGGSAKLMSQVSADPLKREIFISSAVSLAKNYSFDGLDTDWMYPGDENGIPKDKENYILLLTELREVLTKEGLLLTAAVSLQKPVIDKAYDIPAMSAVTDLLLLRGYNFHGTWSTYTHHHAPLYGHPGDTGNNVYLNINYGLEYWVSGGADKSKLVLGLGTYGICWTLDSMDDTGYFASATQAGEPGPYTASLGILGIRKSGDKGNKEIIMATDMRDAARQRVDGGSRSGYERALCVLSGKQDLVRLRGRPLNVGQDHSDLFFSGISKHRGYLSLLHRPLTGQYARSQGLAGTMVWSLETDDFSGSCTGRPYNLIRSMDEGFQNLPFSTPVPPTVAPETTPEAVVTPACSEGNYYLEDIQCDRCDNPGIDSQQYWHCVNGNAIPGECSPGLVWDMAVESCSWPDNVDTSHCVMPGEDTTTITTTTTKLTTTSTTTTELTTSSAPQPECEKEMNYFVSHPLCNKVKQKINRVM
ncbi:acidic mammalian chitinase-like [Penaeus indicus]|uniref:acidic mammalian chitinase-like n=1 Tax=Penaeus indicus TaxID=29960 RepID=UPI00300C2EBF